LTQHYTISGTGKTLVFIHGAFINSDIWKHQIEHFKQTHRVICIDLCGHGRSAPKQELREYSVESFGNDVIDLLKEIGVKKCTLVGLSLGAMIAQFVGARQPNMVEGLILIGSSASMRLRLIEKTITTVIFPKWMAMWLFGQMTIKQFLKLSFFLTWFMRGNRWLGGPETRQLIRQSIAQIKRSEIKKIYAAVHTFRKQDLHAGKFPVLLINGQYDSPVIQYHSLYLNKELGDRSRFLIVPNTGHACNYDRPDFFNEQVEEWMLKNNLLSDLKTLRVNETGYTSKYSRSREIHRAS